MNPPTSPTLSAAPPDPIFTSLSSYPFETDSSFQRGLTSILRSKPNAAPSELDALTTRAQCFYYARKHGLNIDVAAYEVWKRRRGECGAIGSGVDDPGAEGATVVADSLGTAHITGEEHIIDGAERGDGGKGDAAAPYPVTFDEIVELISSGKPVPGIKEIPDTVLEGQESTKITSKRQKPWEKAAIVPQSDGASGAAHARQRAAG